MAKTSEGLISRFMGLRKVVIGALLMALVPFLAGCYGPFPLTHIVYKANGTIEDRVLRQVVFWVLVIVPVYGVSMLVDAIAFNLIEFWTGESIDISTITDEDGNTAVLVPSDDGRTASLTVSKDGRVVQELRFVRVSDAACNVYDSSGHLVGRVVRTPSGELRLMDSREDTVAVIGPGQLAQVLASRGE